MNGSDKILLFLSSSTVTLWWAKVPQFFGGDFLGSLRPGGARMAGKGSPPCPSSALPFWLPSVAPREMTCGGEQRVKWVSQPESLSSPLQEGEEAHRGPTSFPWLWKQTQEKDKERRRQERVRIRMWKKEKEEEWKHMKARGGRKGRSRGDWHLWALFFPMRHHHGPGTTSQTTSGLGKSFSKAPTHWSSFKDNAHYQVDFIIYLLCWEEWVSFRKDDFSAKICFKCILLK